MSILRKVGLAIGGLMLIAVASHAMAKGKTDETMKALIPGIQAWSNGSNVVSAVSAANTANAGLTKVQVRDLGRQWHEGLSGKDSAILSQVNGSVLSQNLKTIQADSHGAYKGIVVTDQKGLIVGETYNAPHYSLASQEVWRKIKKDGISAAYYGKTALGLPVVSENQVLGAVLVTTK